ncbi:MAG TPA: hypothetical protein VFX50_17475 [Gemmatimonadales bacterium]|nr:hypothetical protein [Gemmatimonadales bacterium]
MMHPPVARPARGRSLLLLVQLAALPAVLGAQESGESREPQNTVTVSVGRSRSVEDEIVNAVKAIGGDYMRRLGPSWELGVQLDMDFERGDAAAFLVTPVVAYSITPRWPVFLGAGVAFEAGGHTEAYGRVGSEFMFPLDKRMRWFVAPGAFLDVGHEVTPSLMVAFGHNF